MCFLGIPRKPNGPDVAGLDLSQEAMDMSDTRVNRAGLDILHLVADIEGEYQAHTLANIGFQYLKGDIVSPDKTRAVEYLSRLTSSATPERLQCSLSCITQVMASPKTHKSLSSSSGSNQPGQP